MKSLLLRRARIVPEHEYILASDQGEILIDEMGNPLVMIPWAEMNTPEALELYAIHAEAMKPFIREVAA